MSIRLNKAIRELNIGLQTAVEFLKKKSDLGEVRDDLSFKLNDAQYDALVEEFKSDKEVRSQAEKLFPKHPKEKKRSEAAARPAGTGKPVSTQKYTVLGKVAKKFTTFTESSTPIGIIRWRTIQPESILPSPSNEGSFFAINSMAGWAYFA